MVIAFLLVGFNITLPALRIYFSKEQLEYEYSYKGTCERIEELEQKIKKTSQMLVQLPPLPEIEPPLRIETREDLLTSIKERKEYFWIKNTREELTLWLKELVYELESAKKHLATLKTPSKDPS